MLSVLKKKRNNGYKRMINKIEIFILIALIALFFARVFDLVAFSAGTPYDAIVYDSEVFEAFSLLYLFCAYLTIKVFIKKLIILAKEKRRN